MGYERHSFSQAQGYEEIPGPLKLEELPKEARTRIWNLFFAHLSKSMSADTMGLGGPWIGRPWEQVFQATHTQFDILSLDDWSSDFRPFCKKFRKRIESQPFNKVFDLIQFVLRHPQCPSEFVAGMRRVFADMYRPRVLGQWFDGIRSYAAASSLARSRRTWAGLR